MSLAKKLSALVGVVAVGGGVAVVAQPAEADGEPNIVLLGDSYMATPNQWSLINDHIQAAVPFAPRVAPPTGTSAAGCPQDQHNVGDALRAISGKKVDNYACSGATLTELPFIGNLNPNRLDTLVTKAIDNGALNANTQAVPILIGLNDFYQTGYGWSVNPEDPPHESAAAAELDRQSQRIRQAAPNAKLIYLSYPQVTAPVAPNWLCLVQAGDFRPLNTLGFGYQNSFNIVKRQQSGAAERNGGTYIDMVESTADHSTCAPGRENWVAGIIQANGNNAAMAMHMTDQGVDNMAQQINSRL
ncbi:GDSL-type esterase/lipase family protein [Corynebacterium kroppenstedtii]|uniref:GDSL-type esterase/lipase family protein n=1 Tax=Corynebacterium sp. PCR 32 TaxID=3351342 RepID=UPI0030A112AF